MFCTIVRDMPLARACFVSSRGSTATASPSWRQTWSPSVTELTLRALRLTVWPAMLAVTPFHLHRLFPIRDIDCSLPLFAASEDAEGPSPPTFWVRASWSDMTPSGSTGSTRRAVRHARMFSPTNRAGQRPLDLADDQLPVGIFQFDRIPPSFTAPRICGWPSVCSVEHPRAQRRGRRGAVGRFGSAHS